MCFRSGRRILQRSRDMKPVKFLRH
jgi:hypothetical protein